MPETKRCSNCDKFMIKWPSSASYTHIPMGKTPISWRCWCGNEEFSEFRQNYERFEKAWEEANK